MRSCARFVPAVVFFFLLATASEFANAGVMVNLNVPSGDLNIGSLSPVMTARDRLARRGSVDQLLFKQPLPNGYPAADIVGFGSSFIGSSTYLFTLDHTIDTVNSKSILTFSLTDGTVSGGVTLGNANSTLIQNFNIGELDYNILHIFAVANASGSSVSFSNLQFVAGSGLSTSGSLQTSGSTTSTYDQWIASATGNNLDNFAWKISAKVTLTNTVDVRPRDEGIKFEVSGKRGSYTPPTTVPEPASVAIFGLGFVGFAVRSLRRKIQPNLIG